MSFFSERAVAILLALLLILVSAQAASWSARVDIWEIHRTSSTLNFSYQDRFIGNVTPVEVSPEGRTINGYHSRFLNVKMNDVCLKGTTSALLGDIGGEEKITLVSEAKNPVTENVTKGPDDLHYYIDYREKWPVNITAWNTIGYSGLGINDVDFSGNNLDFMGSRSLYNRRYYRDRTFRLGLDKANITVTAVDQKLGGFQKADLRLTKNSSLGLEIWSTGITDLKYLQASSDCDKPKMAVEERFFGQYRLKARVFMGSNESLVAPDTYEPSYEKSWLECCSYYPENSLNVSQILNCHQQTNR